jgi:hypothetical protein
MSSRKKPPAELLPLRASIADGHPRAALVPLDDGDDLERFRLARNSLFQDLLARSAKSGRISLADALKKGDSPSLRRKFPLQIRAVERDCPPFSAGC